MATPEVQPEGFRSKAPQDLDLQHELPGFPSLNEVGPKTPLKAVPKTPELTRPLSPDLAPPPIAEAKPATEKPKAVNRWDQTPPGGYKHPRDKGAPPDEAARIRKDLLGQ